MAQSVNLDLDTRSKTRIQIPLASAQADLYKGSLAAIFGQGESTDPGDAVEWTNAANKIPAGFSERRSNTVLAEDAELDIGGLIINKVTVTGVTAATDIGRLVYATDGDSFTLTRPAAPAQAVGMVVKWRSSTTCDVLFFGLEAQAQRVESEIWCLGSVDATQAATADVITGYLAGAHGQIIDFWAVVGQVITGGGTGEYDYNLEIATVNVTGGVINIAAGDARGLVEYGSAITGTNEVHEGDAIDVEGTETAALTGGWLTFFCKVLLLPGT